MRSVLTLTILLFFCGSQLVAQAPAQVAWQNVAPGFRVAEVRLYPQSFLSPELLFISVDLDSFRIATVRGIDYGSQNSNVKQLALKSKALVGINANFFDEKNRPLGLVMSHGLRHNPIHKGGKTLTGIFQVGRSGAKVVARSDFNYANVIEAIQAGPRLIDGGAAIGGQRGAHVSSRRAGICVVNPKKVLIYISSGFIGITLSQLQQLLLLPEINCLEALNLDGGGSAQLFVSDKIPQATMELQEIVIHGSDNVPIMLGVFPKER